MSTFICVYAGEKNWPWSPTAARPPTATRPLTDARPPAASHPLAAPRPPSAPRSLLAHRSGAALLQLLCLSHVPGLLYPYTAFFSGRRGCGYPPPLDPLQNAVPSPPLRSPPPLSLPPAKQEPHDSLPLPAPPAHIPWSSRGGLGVREPPPAPPSCGVRLEPRSPPPCCLLPTRSEPVDSRGRE